MSANQHKIVILENNQQLRDTLKTMVTDWGHTPFIFEKESRCLDNLTPLNPDLIISGSLSADSAARVVHTIQMTNCGMPVMIISDDQNIKTFVETNGFGDVSVLKVDSSPGEIESAVNNLLQIGNGDKEIRSYYPLIIGSSPPIVKIKEMISRLDSTDETVLIQGEPGTGKELLARLIQLKSKRSDKPFIKLSIPHLTHDFFENQLLFEEQRPAEQSDLFSIADRGTLLLEEIAELPAKPQAALSKMIDDIGMIRAVGHPLDVRIIATSSRNLADLVESDKFRKELFYRLNVIGFNTPPLRNRLEDISVLTDFFTDKFCIESGRSHFQLSQEIKNLFVYYDWPGNIEELENLVKEIVGGCEESEVMKKLRVHKKYHVIKNSFEDLNSLPDQASIKKYYKNENNISLKKISGFYMQRAEKKLIKIVLGNTNWNRKQAAKLLDISYKSLLNKIKAYKLD